MSQLRDYNCYAWSPARGKWVFVTVKQAYSEKQAKYKLFVELPTKRFDWVAAIDKEKDTTPRQSDI
jgi:hypothetical protein